jgi:carbon-monoxide dehydrogenase small subunit
MPRRDGVAGHGGSEAIVNAIVLNVNGRSASSNVEPRDSLLEVLREHLDLTGTHVGCEHGACGACTVSMDGVAVRSCVVLAVMSDGRRIETIEGTRSDRVMNVIRRHFHEKHAVQCGFCTPGMLMMARDIICRHPEPSETLIREQLSGQICRCTGYANIVTAIRSAAEEMRQA